MKARYKHDFGRFNDRETFALTVVMRMSDMLGTMLGPEETRDALAMVAGMLASDLSADLVRCNGGEKLDSTQVALALVELKRRIGGEFRIEDVTDTRIVLVGKACPFGARVVGRPMLCSMTQNVFARVAEEQTGYGRAQVTSSLARGDGFCRVVVDLVAPALGTPAPEPAPVA